MPINGGRRTDLNKLWSSLQRLPKAALFVANLRVYRYTEKQIYIHTYALCTYIYIYIYRRGGCGAWVFV